MRKTLFHIVLSSLLALAVTDYIWLAFVDEDVVFTELTYEKEKEQESEEEKLKEAEHSLKKELLLIGLYLATQDLLKLHIGPESGYFKNGNSYAPNSKSNKPPKYLRLCRLITYS